MTQQTKQVGDITWEVTEQLGYGKHPEMITAITEIEMFGKRWGAEESFTPYEWQNDEIVKELTQNILLNFISEQFNL